MPFQLTFARPFKKKLTKKTPAQQGAILDCIDRLAADPRHPGLHTHRIQGTEKTWEAYVDDANRVSWEYGETGTILVLAHCNHKQVLGR